MMCEGVVCMAGSGSANDVAVRMFGAMLDASPDALLALTAGGTVTLANAAASRLFGYTPEELNGRPVKSLLGTGFRQDLGHLMAGPVEQAPGHPALLETHALHRDGSAFPAEVAGSHVPDRYADWPGEAWTAHWSCSRSGILRTGTPRTPTCARRCPC